jgi:SSS family solute:Na+ symporter/sodium/proline symporter
MTVSLAGVLLYLAILTAAGAWRARGAQTGEGFLVAGRALPAHVLALTLLATWIGAGSLFGGAGLAYRAGYPALWQSAGAWAGIALAFLLAPRVRRLERYTVADVLEVRYGAGVAAVASVVTGVAYMTIAAYQFRGGGRLLNLVAGIDPAAGALILAACCIAFTAMAGMRSVARLDTINGLVLIVGAALAVVYLVGSAGGTTAALSALRPGQLTVFGAIGPQGALALFLPTFCLLLGEASMYQKFAAARDERTASGAVAAWIVATVAVEVLLVSVAIFGSTAIPGLSGEGSETVIVRVAVDVLPTLLGLSLLAAATAIIVSSANSFLLTAATLVTRDLSSRFGRRAAPDAQVLLTARGAVIGLGAAAVAMGSFFPTILATASWTYTMYAAGITPALLAALVWPRATRQAAVASIAAGLGVTLVWEAAALARGSAAEPAYVFGLQTVYPALAASVGALVGVSAKRG